MNTTTAKRGTRSSGVGPDYLALVREFPLRPLRDHAEYDRAATVLDGLVMRKLSPGERDYLDALTLMVEAYYDDEHAPPAGLERRTPLQRVRWLMDSAGDTPSQFGDIVGSRIAASMFLNGTRGELSKPQIRRLARHLKLDAGFFL
jgi:HTH-type transcriptional regulator/antitoxin HigA